MWNCFISNWTHHESYKTKLLELRVWLKTQRQVKHGRTKSRGLITQSTSTFDGLIAFEIRQIILLLSAIKPLPGISLSDLNQDVRVGIKKTTKKSPKRPKSNDGKLGLWKTICGICGGLRFLFGQSEIQRKTWEGSWICGPPNSTTYIYSKIDRDSLCGFFAALKLGTIKILSNKTAFLLSWSVFQIDENEPSKIKDWQKKARRHSRFQDSIM